MCLSTTVFAMFLTIMGPDRIDSEPGRYIIHADRQDAHWVVSHDKDRWCTIAPYFDKAGPRAALPGGAAQKG